jgi:hypothetical protein
MKCNYPIGPQGKPYGKRCGEPAVEFHVTNLGYLIPRCQMHLVCPINPKHVTEITEQEAQVFSVMGS